MIRLRVHAGELPRHICPVDVALNLPADARVILYQQPGRRPRACQVEPQRSGCRLHWLVTRLAAGTTQDYLIEIKPERRRPVRRFRWRDLPENGVQLHLDGAPVLDLDIGPERKHPGLKLYRPGSAEPVLCDIIATAGLGHHLHHRTALTTLETPSSGPAFAQLRFRGRWESETALPILTETRLLRCYATPKAFRLIHLALQLQATAGPVAFETGPTAGVVQFSLAPPLQQDSRLKVYDAVGIPGCGHPSPWLHLQADGWGLGILDHPRNPGSPCCWRFDSVVIANPWATLPRFAGMLPSVQPTLQVGEWLRFDYRIVLYEDQVRRGAVRAAYGNIVNPPVVEVLD